MRFKRYPRWEPYEITSRKLAAARRAVQKEKDRYPLFPELLKHQTGEERLAAIANDRKHWWQEMRDHRAKQWRRVRRALRALPPGPRAAIKRYWQICGFPGDPDYLLSMIHEHKARKVCYWHVMAELRRLHSRFSEIKLTPSAFRRAISAQFSDPCLNPEPNGLAPTVICASQIHFLAFRPFGFLLDRGLKAKS